MHRSLIPRRSQPYLPQIYVETDMDATNCYIFFQRLAAKIDLINTFVAQAHNLPDALNGTVSEALVGICEVCPHRSYRYDVR